MKKLIFSVGLLALMGGGAAFAASPMTVVETLPYSNESNQSVVCSTGSVSGVTVSSSTITRIDSTFNTAATSACKASFSRAEIVTQNQQTFSFYCGYSGSGVTADSSSFKLASGSVWTWKIGKGMGIYCLSEAGSSGALTVGGMAYR